MIQTTRLESSQKVLCSIISRDACLNPQNNEFPHRVKVTSSEYTKRFFKITTQQKWITTKLYSFTLQLNSKFASTARGGQITNFKENCNLKKKSLPMVSRYLFRNSDNRKLHRRTFDPSIKRQIYSMCPENVFGYQRSCYKLINKWKRDHLKNFQSVYFGYKLYPEPS